MEINALWYNALRLLERWLREEGDTRADDLGRRASQTLGSFNVRFWNASRGFLFDIVDGESR